MISDKFEHSHSTSTMKATYSPANDFSTLPEELVIEILSTLDLSDLISCRCVNRRLNGVIDNSEQLQHQIDTAVAGVVDNPSSSLSLRERREALARRQDAWDNCQPRSTSTSEVDNVLQASLDDSWLPLGPLREVGYHMIDQLAISPDNSDLIAIGIR
jgi:hypothetical protein